MFALFEKQNLWCKMIILGIYSNAITSSIVCRYLKLYLVIPSTMICTIFDILLTYMCPKFHNFDVVKSLRLFTNQSNRFRPSEKF